MAGTEGGGGGGLAHLSKTKLSQNPLKLPKCRYLTFKIEREAENTTKIID